MIGLKHASPRSKFYGICLFLVVLPFTACQLPEPSIESQCQISISVDSTVLSTYAFQYQMSDPDAVLKLPGKLEEVSGLGMSEDEEHLLAIQDEDGILFWVNKKTGKIDKQVKFWKDGDYEGIEFVDGKIYVIKSTGTVYKVESWDQEEPIVNKFNTILDASNDVEGLGYDPISKQLLLACKAQAGEGAEFDRTKAIYGFDLSKDELIVDPRYCIKLEQVNEYLDTNPMIRKLEKLNEFFAPGDSEFGFSPSSVAVHPHTNELYVLSSVGKILMVLNRKGQILHIEKLKKSVHEQPEGMCFDQKGNLYIANEGRGGKGTVYQFNFLP